MDKRHLKDIKECDGCASRKSCFVYFHGKCAIDCNGYIKEVKTTELVSRKKPTFALAK